MTSMTIALAGNPNVGKSTIFNGLTGVRQHTGNWPGKTVEKKEGLLSLRDGADVILVDLPGTYSLTAYSIEETISRDFIIGANPDLVIVVVDAANLERNLYLVLQVLELGAPTMVALNMVDTARQRGITIDKDLLSQQLNGIPIVETIGNHGVGLDHIREYVNTLMSARPPLPSTPVKYNQPVDDAITQLSSYIVDETALARDYPPRWLSIKLLEEDPQIYQELERRGEATLLAMTVDLLADIEEACDEAAEILITDSRYMVINQLVDLAVSRVPTSQETLTDRIDAVVTHRWLGIPIFLLLMWLVFQFTANVSAPLVDWIDALFAGPITGLISLVFQVFDVSQSWIASLVLDGILPAVGGVLVFIPVLMFLYIAIALLEDTGYMARAAFVMDRGMRSLGLHGKSFLPMLVGFGCTVPAVYATRTLENDRERKLTGFLLTFMSCGARLPVYVVFGAAFFGANSGNLVFGMYLLGIIVALATGLIIRKTIMRHDPVQPFVMELPPYRRPRLRDVMLQTWDRTYSFIRKATSVILVMSMIIWLMLAIPVRDGGFNDVAPENSVFGQVSGAVSPVFAPAGFGTWEATGSLITGMVAKEVIIGTMSQVYLGAEDEPLQEPPTTLQQDVVTSVQDFGVALALTAQEIVNIVPRTVNVLPLVTIPELDIQAGAASDESTSQLETVLGNHFTAASAVAFTAFVLLYVPCIATLAAMRQEFGRKWVLQQVGYTLLLAWFAAVIVYQVVEFLGTTS